MTKHIFDPFDRTPLEELADERFAARTIVDTRKESRNPNFKHLMSECPRVRA